MPGASRAGDNISAPKVLGCVESCTLFQKLFRSFGHNTVFLKANLPLEMAFG
jgi:hypothetical protein